MRRHETGRKITRQQILNMLPEPPGGLSIKEIINEFKRIRISVRETAVYYLVRTLEAAGLIRREFVRPKDRIKRRTGYYAHSLTKKGLDERDRLNALSPQHHEQNSAEEYSETEVFSVKDYIQVPLIPPE